jgi:hypothetical protein
MMSDDKEKQPDLAATVDRIAATIGLEIAAPPRQGVIDNFERIAALASLVMAFPLPDETDISQIFVP